jgi:hypothetical protein
VHIETAKGLPPKESLLPNPTDSSHRCVIDKPFLFGKSKFFNVLVLSDAELEENLENLPLLVA